jgi:hypothetical protein
MGRFSRYHPVTVTLTSMTDYKAGPENNNSNYYIKRKLVFLLFTKYYDRDIIWGLDM